ncbi:hypothetical protein TRICI_003368 [Trichomonascus ciferrii]|uniref:Mnd1 HTH domain-containing protein n=1 Tax=Trichomonascus ciferrii TaxID=44093 RepID=A0A642V4A4_9ASCO|nr:hypothetical protein TRICI_003368 [Trichomonascus ciferrii]
MREAVRYMGRTDDGECICGELISMGSFHSLKELESALKGRVDGFQLKAIIKDLSDQSLISAEKIGTSNYYWKFDESIKHIEDKHKAIAAKAQTRNNLQSLIESEAALRSRPQNLQTVQALEAQLAETKSKATAAQLAKTQTQIANLQSALAQINENIEILLSTIQSYTEASKSEILDYISSLN